MSSNATYDYLTATVTVTDPRTPLWQQLAGLSRPAEKDGWDVAVRALVVIGAIVMALCGSGVLVVAMLSLFVVMLACKKARLSVSAYRSATVWSPSHVADLRTLAAAGCTEGAMWEAALSYREARILAGRCF